MQPSQRSEERLPNALDRTAFAAYFLGAVVPLVGFGFVLDRYALADSASRSDAIGLIVGLLFVGMLSLVAFAMLRQMARSALARMDRDNRRLTALLDGATALAASEHISDALASACREAQQLVDADAVYVYLASEEKDGPELSGSHGDAGDALASRHGDALDSIVTTAIESERPALQAARAGEPAIAAIPLPADTSLSAGAIAALRERESFRSEEIGALSVLAGIGGVALHNADLRDAQRNFFTHMTDLLVNALDSHLGTHHGHGERVARLANRVGRAVGLDDASLQRLHFASLLHDIGMLKIDRAEQANRSAREKHTILGFRMLSRIRLWREIGPIVHQHHEWWDGSGYPEARSGDDIALEARIVALCDAVDTMTSPASYRSALDSEETLAELERCAGTQFDPKLVGVLVELVNNGHLELGES